VCTHVRMRCVCYCTGRLVCSVRCVVCVRVGIAVPPRFIHDTQSQIGPICMLFCTHASVFGVAVHNIFYVKYACCINSSHKNTWDEQALLSPTSFCRQILRLSITCWQARSGCANVRVCNPANRQVSYHACTQATTISRGCEVEVDNSTGKRPAGSPPDTRREKFDPNDLISSI